MSDRKGAFKKLVKQKRDARRSDSWEHPKDRRFFLNPDEQESSAQNPCPVCDSHNKCIWISKNEVLCLEGGESPGWADKGNATGDRFEYRIYHRDLVDLPILTFQEILKQYPSQRPVLIDGLLRIGETMNVISAPKIGKSWSTVGLAFAVATGRPWFGKFATEQGRVLIVDNELHCETIAHRLRTVAQAADIHIDLLADSVSILPLRGRLRDINKLGMSLRKLGRGRYKLVILDAFYRCLPSGTDENDNGAMAGLYNALDTYTDDLGASFTNIHHSSKGDQTTKSITDVGSGAGAQSRATDTHLIMRPHEEDNAIVLDAAVRSFAPVSPVCLRWNYPLWTLAPDLDPACLRQPRSRKKKTESEPTEPPWNARRFADVFGKEEPRPRDVILEEARLLKLSDRKASELLKAAIGCGYLNSWKAKGANSKTLVCKRNPV